MTNQQEKLSVIIPVFNDQEGIDKCLLALSKQTIDSSKFEIIIVDNASDTPIQHQAEPELDVHIINCPIKGSYAARNEGVKHARHTVLVFLDADCYPANNWLESGLISLNNHPDKKIIGGEVALINSEKPTTTEQYQCLVGFEQQANIELKKFTATANVFLYKSDFEEIGPFEERLLSGGDREWAWRAEKKGYTVVYCKNTIVYTPPRRSFFSAVKQARRVTGGRHYFKQLGLVQDSDTEQRLSPRRNSWESVLWLLNQKQISLLNRIKILCVASLLKVVQVFETLRLRMGSTAERC